MVLQKKAIFVKRKKVVRKVSSTSTSPSSRKESLHDIRRMYEIDKMKRDIAPNMLLDSFLGRNDQKSLSVTQPKKGNAMNYTKGALSVNITCKVDRYSCLSAKKDTPPAELSFSTSKARSRGLVNNG